MSWIKISIYKSCTDNYSTWFEDTGSIGKTCCCGVANFLTHYIFSANITFCWKLFWFSQCTLVNKLVQKNCSYIVFSGHACHKRVYLNLYSHCFLHGSHVTFLTQFPIVHVSTSIVKPSQISVHVLMFRSTIWNLMGKNGQK